MGCVGFLLAFLFSKRMFYCVVAERRSIWIEIVICSAIIRYFTRACIVIVKIRDFWHNFLLHCAFSKVLLTFPEVLFLYLFFTSVLFWGSPSNAVGMMCINFESGEGPPPPSLSPSFVRSISKKWHHPTSSKKRPPLKRRGRIRVHCFSKLLFGGVGDGATKYPTKRGSKNFPLLSGLRNASMPMYVREVFPSLKEVHFLLRLHAVWEILTSRKIGPGVMGESNKNIFFKKNDGFRSFLPASCSSLLLLEVRRSKEGKEKETRHTWDVIPAVSRPVPLSWRAHARR